MSTVFEPAPRAGQAPPPVAHGHRSGTTLDDDIHTPQASLPGKWMALGMFVVLAGIYFALGYKTTIDQHVIVYDALDRLTRAYLVWHNDPPKLAAIGFVFPPLTTFVFLPFAVVKPIATSLIALPLTSAVFAAATVVMLDRTLARCDMNVGMRLPLLALFAFNPFWLFYAGNGMSEVVYSFFLVLSLYCFISWYTTTEARFLIGAGFGLSLLVISRYAFLVWAALFAVLIAVALVRRRASRIEVEGSVIAFAAPIIYIVALWILFNWLIIGEPFSWIADSTTSAQAVNATGLDTASDVGFGDVARRLLELNVAVFPLAFLVVPALVITYISQRNDMALWLASLVVLGMVVIGAHAYLSDEPGLLTLRDSMPMYVAAFIGAAWLFRTFETFRPLVFAATVVLLVVNLFTAWNGMQNYPFQSLEQAWVNAIKTGDDQEGRASRGGYTVGIEAEAQMANFINRTVSEDNSILADNAQTYGVIQLSGRPQLFFDRVDEGDSRFREILAEPAGEVDYLLATTNERSADLVRQAYPQANDGSIDGLEVVARTERYVLLRVTSPAATRRGAEDDEESPAASGAGAASGAASPQTDDGDAPASEATAPGATEAPEDGTTPPSPSPAAAATPAAPVDSAGAP